jgi:hypothetical protein
MLDSGAMPQIDVSAITDPDVRRAVRSMVQLQQTTMAQVHQQQQEIEALLQMLVEKHVGSIGEFKRHMIKMQSADPRSERLHGQIASVPPVHASGSAAVSHGVTPQPRRERQPEVAQPEVDGPRRYTL